MTRQPFHPSPRPEPPLVAHWNSFVRNLSRIRRGLDRQTACPGLVTNADARTWRWVCEMGGWA